LSESKRTGLLFIVSAPSGAGKTSLCKALMKRLEHEGERPLSWSVSYTTRPRRKGEEHGTDYFFVDEAEFDRMVAAAEFAEWAVVHGRRYGTSKAHIKKAAEEGRDLLIEIDVQGARQLKDKIPGAVFVFILPPSWDTLSERLKGRATEEDIEVERRLAAARREVLEWSWFDYIIINDDFNAGVDCLRAVVIAARHTREAMEERVRLVIENAKA